ncbi:MAG: methyltransferase domain-containing protein [Candidatus Aegiribacteria sp.]|nr:methyltransferase domain-containing protein [Candidatus Aegiribacteria sp.]MBD3295470.1 methyltransferase domain-containing protein [Candidatus Fermentibacteria bacterium]
MRSAFRKRNAGSDRRPAQEGGVRLGADGLKPENRIWEQYGPYFSFEERYVFPEDTDEIEFYRRLRNRYTGNCIELGAGDGRLTEKIWDEKYLTVALEPAVSMMKRWKEPDHRRISRVLAEAGEIPVASSSMDLVLFPYNGLHCILNRDRRRRVLRECARLLKSGGRFVAETCPGFAERPEETDSLRYNYKRGNTSLRLDESVRIHKDSDRILFHMTYSGSFVKEGSTGITLELALIPASQLLQDLRSAGMSVCALWGDYDLTPWSGEYSPRLLLMAGRSE